MIDTVELWSALRQVDDPEMPLSIVDLGMVAHVRVESLNESATRAGGAATGGVAAAPRAIDGAARVVVDVMPTFVGCPALLVIEEAIVRRLRALPGVAAVHVNFVYEPAWSVDRISDAGRASLKAKGITVPQRGGAATVTLPATLVPLTVHERGTAAHGVAEAAAGGEAGATVECGSSERASDAMNAAPDAQGCTNNTQGASAIACPWCGSADTQLESAFGPTRCKAIYYCRACRNSFEHMKRV